MEMETWKRADELPKDQSTQDFARDLVVAVKPDSQGIHA